MALLTTGTESTTQIWDILHDFFKEGVFDQFHTFQFLRDKVKTNHVDGREYKIKVKLGMNRAGGFKAERAAIGSAKGRLFDEMTMAVKLFYVPFDITGPEIYLGKGKDKFIDVVSDAVEDSTESARQQTDVVGWGNGSGRIAQVNGDPTYDGTNLWTSFAVDNCSLQHFFMYQDVNFGDDTTDYEIKKIDYVNSTIYVGGNASSVAVDDAWIYRDGAYDSGLYTEPLGLSAHISDSNPPSGAYQDMDRTAAGFDWLIPHVEDNAGAALTTTILTTFFDDLTMLSGGLHPDLIITEPGVRTSFVLLLQSMHQNVEPVVSKTGFAEKLKFVYGGKNMELQVTHLCPNGKLWAVNTDFLSWDEARPLGWDQEFGNNKLIAKSGYDIFEGRLISYYNISNTFPRAHGLLDDIKRNDIT